MQGRMHELLSDETADLHRAGLRCFFSRLSIDNAFALPGKKSPFAH